MDGSYNFHQENIEHPHAKITPILWDRTCNKKLSLFEFTENYKQITQN